MNPCHRINATGKNNKGLWYVNVKCCFTATFMHRLWYVRCIIIVLYHALQHTSFIKKFTLHLYTFLIGVGNKIELKILGAKIGPLLRKYVT